MFLAVCLLLGFLRNQVFGADPPEWSYTGDNGPGNWSVLYSTCGGYAQSPVELDEKQFIVTDPVLKNFIFESYFTNEMTIKNNGKNVEFELVNGEAKISGGGLPSVYKLHGFHFHWGQSEHRWFGSQFSAELHLVHYDATRFGSLKEALGNPNGVAILAVFIGEKQEFKESSEELPIFRLDIDEGPGYSAEFQKLIPSLSNVNKSGESTTFNKTIQLLDFLPLHKPYFRYEGSTTTPPCSGYVIWTVFEFPVYFSHEQLETLRSLNGEDGQIKSNVRPVQPLNFRIMSYHEVPLNYQ